MERKIIIRVQIRSEEMELLQEKKLGKERKENHSEMWQEEMKKMAKWWESNLAEKKKVHYVFFKVHVHVSRTVLQKYTVMQ